MAQGLVFLFDPETDAAVRALWARLEQAGVPSLATHTHRKHRPHVTFALASAIPPVTRDALRADLRQLSIPRLWLNTLAAFATIENVLMLAAVVDTELLAVHSAIHDILAGRVKQPSAYYLPGSWVPHCTLAEGIEPAQTAAGFAAVHPVEPIHATVTEIGVMDSRTGAVDPVVELA